MNIKEAVVLVNDWERFQKEYAIIGRAVERLGQLDSVEVEFSGWHVPFRAARKERLIKFLENEMDLLQTRAEPIAARISTWE